MRTFHPIVRSTGLLSLAFFAGCATTRTVDVETTAGSTYGEAYSYEAGREQAAAASVFAGEQPAAPARELGKELPTDARACYDALWFNGTTFELVHDEKGPVEMPIRLTSPLGGVAVEPMNQSDTHAVMDCRLALQILRWSPSLRSAGVKRIGHYSAYRPGARIAGSGKVSAHASALALDLATLQLENGDTVEVLTDWEDRERGQEPCPRRGHESYPSRVLRGVVCDAVDRGLFQVVLTPHYDDDHQNHVHLELRPDVDWTYVK